MSRGAILDSPVCLNAGGRYFVDIVFNKQPDSTPSSHILIDSVRKSQEQTVSIQDQQIQEQYRQKCILKHA